MSAGAASAADREDRLGLQHASSDSEAGGLRLEEFLYLGRCLASRTPSLVPLPLSVLRSPTHGARAGQGPAETTLSAAAAAAAGSLQVVPPPAPLRQRAGGLI